MVSDAAEEAREVLSNSIMAELYGNAARSLGKKYYSRAVEETISCGSTDMGNVSWVVPSIHPMFRIPTKRGESNHHVGFTEMAGKIDALLEARNAGKSMAMCCLDLFSHPEFIQQAKMEFLKVKEGGGSAALRPRRS